MNLYLSYFKIILNSSILLSRSLISDFKVVSTL
ncbi:hypothetical protein bpuSUM_001360 (plasmid) [Borrelia puertoricensis]|nr:hypothetical protein bpuSUM_001360 [Borrelia puertoricensis]